MSSAKQNLSSQKVSKKEDYSSYKIAIIVADWNSEITNALSSGAISRLIDEGVKSENIVVKSVPGAFELTLASQLMAQKSDIDAVIAIGCVIKGDTPHFEYICQGVTMGITEVNLKFNKPVIFGVLTTNNEQQALDRSGGKHGNKGDEAAVTALKMLSF